MDDIHKLISGSDFKARPDAETAGMRPELYSQKRVSESMSNHNYLHYKNKKTNFKEEKKMANMTKMDELMKNEEFVSKLEKCDTEDSVKALYAEYDLDANETDELNEDDLDQVTGGFGISAGMAALIIAAAPFAWKSGAKFGILVRANYDYNHYGNMYRTYSKSQVDAAIDYFDRMTR